MAVVVTRFERRGGSVRLRPSARRAWCLTFACASVALCLTSGAAAAPLLGARAAAAGAGRPLLAVSCSSVRACTAVGGVFAERWSGGPRWSVQPVPAPPFSARGFDFLAGVSCPGKARCLAVGLDHPPIGANVDYDYSALAESWDGTTWSVQSPTVAQTSNSFLQAVSCVSVSDCVAVGQGITSPLAMSWDGGGWTVEQAPAASSAMAILNGVSCGSAASCIAVGSVVPNSVAPSRGLAERWNGRHWSTVRTPSPPPGEDAILNAVACRRAVCIAVGDVGPRQLIERWNGRKWSMQRLPANVPAELNGVSCVTASDCVAVGALTNNSHQSLAERWDGRRWRVERTPTPAGGSLLWAVSCPSALECVAVGQRGSSPLVERWNGRLWSIQSTT